MPRKQIGYITPGGVDPFAEHYRSTFAEAALPGTEVVCLHLDIDDEARSPFLPDLPFYYGELFRTIKRLEDEGYDGVIIGCSADPGLIDARRMVRMPVTAPLEANLRIADMLGVRVAVFVPGDIAEQTQYETLARFYRLDHTLAWIAPVDLGYPPEDDLARLMAGDRQRLLEIVLDCHRAFLDEQLPELAEAAVDEHGAEALYFGCTLWTGMVADLADSIGVPVLDPGIGALRAAEFLADALPTPVAVVN